MFEKFKEKLRNGVEDLKDTMGGYRPFDDGRVYDRIRNQYQDSIDEEVDGMAEDVKDIMSSSWPDENKNMTIDIQKRLRKVGYRFYLEDAYIMGEMDAAIDAFLWSTMLISLVCISKFINKKLKK